MDQEELGFLTTEQRGLDPIPQVSGPIPQIEGGQENQPEKVNYTPFNTSSKRELDVGRDVAELPCPGDYQVGSTLDQRTSTKASFNSETKRFAKSRKGKFPEPGDLIITN